MSTIIHTFQLAMFFAALLIGLFMVCLSVPESRLRDCCLQVAGWGLAALSVIYAVSPIDFIPGIPVDDWIVLAGGFAAAVQAWDAQRRNGKRAA
jgi:uncharacterized membrane protein YkvA (DUF1232 family)